MIVVLLRLVKFSQIDIALKCPNRSMAVLLELLSDVGVRQPLQEARELVESTYSLRADVLRPCVSRSADGLLVLKP